MEYNINYINLKYTLIHCFLVKADKNILDISYSVAEKQITIQVVLLEGTTLSEEKKCNVKESLGEFDVKLIVLYLSKEQFNRNKGKWLPQSYKWLDYLLFSKAEVL